ncbi:putative acetyltransferase [Bradyrhizobium sp. LB1.3]
MAHALPKPGLRPFLLEDVPVLAAIFIASIEELTGDDYSEAQQQAWMAAAEDEEFGNRLASDLTLIATLEGSPVGFASLRGKDHIHMLYVHPAVAGQGLATILVDALEKLAGGRGADKLTVDASDNAQGFFAKRGYVAMQRNSITINDEWLANTPPCRRRSAPDPRREHCNEQGAPLSFRHHAARRRADQWRRFHAEGQASHRGDAR